MTGPITIEALAERVDHLIETTDKTLEQAKMTNGRMNRAEDRLDSIEERERTEKAVQQALALARIEQAKVVVARDIAATTAEDRRWDRRSWVPGSVTSLVALMLGVLLQRLFG